MAERGKALPYYNFDRLYSYNAPYMFVCGSRGIGKTFGTKRRAIRNAINKGEQFIYLRRYKSELSGRATFFADIHHEFPEYNFRINGMRAEMILKADAKQKGARWTIIGFFVALSNAQSQKGVSFHDVTTIIFDEFIIEKGALHYLPNEADVFNNFYVTVDRFKDKTRVFFLANAVSIMNPYFLKFNIRPDQVGEWSTHYDGFVVCHFVESAEFSTAAYETRFGKFIQGTEYGDYALGNEFADANDRLLGFKTSKAKYLYTLETQSGTFSVWVDWALPTYFAQEKRPKKEILYTMDPDKMENGKTLMLYNDKLMQYLRAAFKNGSMVFDSPNTRNAFIEVFRR